MSSLGVYLAYGRMEQQAATRAILGVWVEWGSALWLWDSTSMLRRWRLSMGEVWLHALWPPTLASRFLK